ncbi:uncharacterized protein SPSC_05328 [Sporisorium scitamineum]|uniref:Uncharacterized protein n=1 Tax=Sporisorium scitamineum TaxID=49012 RepID=A0A127ZHA9_9BASI|nr:uncharacterized protein SPSC_05328 [Sporisorium scitamineum]
MLQHGAEASSHRGTFSRPAAVVPDLGPSSSSGIDLDLYLGNSERQRELKRQRVEELKEAAQEYYGKDFESWPHASITRGRYALYISKVKKRALSAFQLYEKYLDLIKPFVPVEQRSKIWPLSKFKEWYNANPDNVEYMSTSKADAVDNQYRDIKQQVGIIEEALHKAKSL